MILRRSGKVLLFGGCYSNLQATQALLQAARRLGIPPENMVCTGDIIAYGADAAATFQLIQGAGIVSIMGNCEQSLARAAADCGCGFAPGSLCDELAAAWYRHATRQIDDGARRLLARLPARVELQIGDKKFAVLHGNAERINAFVFPSAGNLELSRQIELTGCDGVIAGHCGIPFTRRLDAGIWHNPGSIGLPANDGTSRGWFSIIEVIDGEIRITAKPLTYDAAAAAAAMRRASLPEAYAEALQTGIWPSLDVLPAAERQRTGIALAREPEPQQGWAPPAPAPSQALRQLETLWVNTGTLCNLSCTLCFMESTPANDALSYFALPSLREILADAPPGLREIGFTGGEPFMNPELLPMLALVLAAGKRAVVLTNGMRPMQRVGQRLAALITAYPGRLAVRVSLDHYAPDRHEALRGAGSFAPALTGLKFLADAGALTSVAARTPWGETDAMMRAGFARLLAAHGIGLDAADPARLVLFPEMDAASPIPGVTAAALAALPPDQPPMCASSRMVVRRRGAAGVSFTPCTLLPNHGLAARLKESLAPVALDHPHCAQFCVYGGASCV